MMVGVGMTMNDHLYSRKRYIEIKICIFTFNYMYFPFSNAYFRRNFI